MMDWASNDCTRDYADTFYTRAPESDTGVYTLDEAGQRPASNRNAVPIRGYDARAPGRYGQPNLRPEPPGFAGYAERGGAGREGFNGSGSPYSERASGNLDRVYASGWDERPMHYNPNAGKDWAHLVPPPCARPYGGGPAPSLAFPLWVTQSEGADNPRVAPQNGSLSRECFTGGTAAQAAAPLAQAAAPLAQAAAPPAQALSAQNMELLKIMLLIVLVVMLAMTMSTAHRIEKQCQKASKRLALAGHSPPS